MLDKFDTKSAIAVTLIASMVMMAFLLAIRNPDSDIFKMLMGGLVTVGFASALIARICERRRVDVDYLGLDRLRARGGKSALLRQGRRGCGSKVRS